MQRLSELEACVLGLISQSEGCTAYDLRQMFRKSPTSSWNVSTGTIYPLVRKLLRRGLITARTDPENGRSAQRLSLEPTGREALVEWLSDSPEWLADPSADPIRTRLLFLEELDQAERAAFVGRAVAATGAAIEALEATIKTISAGGDRFERLAHLGALAQLKTRHEWLRQVEHALLEG